MKEVAVAFKIQEKWKELLPEGIVSLQRYVTSSSPSLHKLGDPHLHLLFTLLIPRP